MADGTVWPDPYKKTSTSGPNGWAATPYICPTTGLMKVSGFSGKSMLDVMNFTDDGGMKTLGRYIGAALLNARSGRTPVLSETTVRQMWNALASGVPFEPTAGVKWGPSEIVAYIKTTMG
jgi:hypothetical protein